MAPVEHDAVLHGAVAVVGATASGKSALGLAAARARPGTEIVTVDSMQVYRGMDVGTASPTPSERAEVRHHLVDLVEPTEEFGVADHQRAALGVLADIAGRGGRALLVGGTGLYLRALVDHLDIPGRWPEVRAGLEAELDAAGSGARLHARLVELDPVAAARMEPTNARRVLRALEVTLGSGRAFSSFGPGLDAHPPTPVRMLGLDVPLDVLDRRIEARLHRQVANGFLDEARALHQLSGRVSRTAGQALGYAELSAHLDGTLTLDEAVAEAVRRTRRFARRQLRWFRRDPRIEWLPVADDPLAPLPTVLAALDATPPCD